MHQNLAHPSYKAGLCVLEVLTDTVELQKQQEGRVRPAGQNNPEDINVHIRVRIHVSSARSL